MYYKSSIFFEKNFFYIYFFIALVKNFLISNVKILVKSIIYNRKIFTQKCLNEVKKSNTLFILGSGDSINDINNKQWEEIKQSDSLGINSWLVHKHMPTYMLIEGAKKSDLNKGKVENDFNYELILNSTKRSNQTIFIFKDVDNLYINFEKLTSIKDRTYLLLKLIIPGKIPSSINTSLRLINRLLIFKNIMFPIGTRGSVTHALSFGILAGYKNIILCGFDGQGPYFWERSRPDSLSTILPDFFKKSRKFSGTHVTMSKKFGAITVDEVLKSISDNLNSNKDEKIYINSNKSLLKKFFPTYWN